MQCNEVAKHFNRKSPHDFCEATACETCTMLCRGASSRFAIPRPRCRTTPMLCHHFCGSPSSDAVATLSQRPWRVDAASGVNQQHSAVLPYKLVYCSAAGLRRGPDRGLRLFSCGCLDCVVVRAGPKWTRGSSFLTCTKFIFLLFCNKHSNSIKAVAVQP